MLELSSQISKSLPLERNQRALNLLFKDLSECWFFAAEMFAMSDIWCRFLPNENKQGWCNKEIQFSIRYSIWRFIWLRPCIQFLILTVILAIMSNEQYILFYKIYIFILQILKVCNVKRSKFYVARGLKSLYLIQVKTTKWINK